MEPNLNLPLRLKLRLIANPRSYSLGLDVIIYDENTGATLQTCSEWSIDGKVVDSIVTLSLRCMAGLEVSVPSPHKPAPAKVTTTVDGQPYELDPDSIVPMGDNAFSVGFKPADGEFSSFHPGSASFSGSTEKAAFTGTASLPPDVVILLEDDCTALRDGVLTRMRADGSSIPGWTPEVEKRIAEDNSVQVALRVLDYVRENGDTLVTGNLEMPRHTDAQYARSQEIITREYILGRRLTPEEMAEYDIKGDV